MFTNKPRTKSLNDYFVVYSLSLVWLFVNPWMATCKASLSFTISWSLLKFMSIYLVMPSNHLALCCPLLLLPSIFPKIRVFSNESVLLIQFNSVQFSCSVTRLCPGLCDPMDCSMLGFPVLHYLPEFAQTHVHWVDNAIQSSHPLQLPSPPALNLSKH